MIEVVRASAPGKVILFGEHFVVRGKPAIAIALSPRIYVTVKKPCDGSNKITIRSRNINYELVLDPLTLEILELKGELLQLKRILEELRRLSGKLEPALVEIYSEIPVAAGLGSSASLAVAFTAAFSRYIGLMLSREEISRIAFEAEKVVHGRPSGIDNTIATYGGAILYREGMFSQIKVGDIRDYFIIADTGVPRSTREAVLKVLDLYKRYSQILEHVYIAAEKIVEEAKTALEEADTSKLGELMNINHGLLSAVGVSSLELERLVHIARINGALGSKITGAGIGGAIIALASRENAGKVYSTLRRYAKNIIKASIDWEGIRIEQR